MILICIIIILVVVLLYQYYTEWDHTNSLGGMWVGTESFCKDADLTSMMMILDTKKEQLTDKGHLVMLDGNNILSNQKINVKLKTGRNRQPYFKSTIDLKCEEDQILPKKLNLEINKHGIMTLKKGDTLYAELYKAA